MPTKPHLTDAQARKIYELSAAGVSRKDLALRFGVHFHTIRDYINREKERRQCQG